MEGRRGGARREKVMGVWRANVPEKRSVEAMRCVALRCDARLLFFESCVGPQFDARTTWRKR